MIPRHTNNEISALALHMLGGRVLTFFDVPILDVPMVFLPLTFGALNDIEKGELADLVVLAVEGKHHQMGLYVNGNPMFAEIELWHIDDFRIAADKAEHARATVEDG